MRLITCRSFNGIRRHFMAFPPPPPPPSFKTVEDAGQQLVDTLTTAATDTTTGIEQTGGSAAQSGGDAAVTFVATLVSCVVAVVSFEASRAGSSAGSTAESLNAQLQQVQDAIAQIMSMLRAARQHEQTEQDSLQGRQEMHGQIMASIEKAYKSYLEMLQAVSSAPASTSAPPPSGNQTERSAYSLQRLEFIINGLIPAVQRHSPTGSSAVQTVGKLHRLLFQVRVSRAALSQANSAARFAQMQKVSVAGQGFKTPIGGVPWMR
jgi:hypothetical protein